MNAAKGIGPSLRMVSAKARASGPDGGSSVPGVAISGIAAIIAAFPPRSGPLPVRLFVSRLFPLP